ncbi:MAG TPA: hypothetical protein VHV79_10955 [Mycobacteriales bacterium]|nr:hypothetical protein [Mycobacteriales bacterium]
MARRVTQPRSAEPFIAAPPVDLVAAADAPIDSLLELPGVLG